MKMEKNHQLLMGIMSVLGKIINLEKTGKLTTPRRFKLTTSGRSKLTTPRRSKLTT
jgi:hypothetical protein